jgi:hypothetical protein
MGIDVKIFIEISSHLLCPVCLDVFDDAATSLCGHTCCYSCWYSIAKSSPNTPKDLICPLCRESYYITGLESFSTFIFATLSRTLISNIIIKKMVEDWLTKCPRSGCGEEIAYSNRHNHYSNCLDSLDLGQLDTIHYLPTPDFLSPFDMMNEDSDDDFPYTEFFLVKWCQSCGIGFSEEERFDQHVEEVHTIEI